MKSSFFFLGGDERYLSPEYLEYLAAAVRNRTGYMNSNVWAFIDGTYRFLCRPSSQLGPIQRMCYSQYKKRFTLKFSVVTTPAGMIFHIFGPCPANMNDSRMLSESELLEFIGPRVRLPDRTYSIYGDGIYPLSDLLLRGYTAVELTHPVLGPARRFSKFPYFLDEKNTNTI